MYAGMRYELETIMRLPFRNLPLQSPSFHAVWIQSHLHSLQVVIDLLKIDVLIVQHDTGI